MQNQVSKTSEGNTYGDNYSHNCQFEKPPKKKGTCPNCGHKNEFRYYEDRNGNRIEDAGKCERINSCQYHIKPNYKLLKLDIPDTILSELVKINIIFPDKKVLASIESFEKNISSNFHKMCISQLEIPSSHLQKWGVGTDKEFTVFIFKTQDNRIANIKHFKYLESFKRDKSVNAFSLKQPKDGTTKYMMPLYGEHLLCKEKNKIVCVVESEKTAIIASWFYPNFDFVACGAANGLTSEKLSILFGRKIYWLADADKAGRDNSSLKNLKAYVQNFEIIDLFPDRDDGKDLADAIIEGKVLGLKIPEIDIQKKQDLKNINYQVEDNLKSNSKINEIINKHRVRTTNEYHTMDPVIHIGESLFGVRGDLSFISGLPKVGKSTVTRFLIATALMEIINENDDVLSIRTQYCNGKKIIYLDTEQNPSDTKKMIQSIMDIAKLDKEPENLIALNFRDLSHSENRETLKELFEYYSDAYLWIIDGITDFLPSANDEVVSNELIRDLMKMSLIHNTCIVCLIHENGGNNGKMRGHIGSEAARKCQGAISITYEEHAKVHAIKSTFFRGSKKIDPVFWEFNQNGRPVSCDVELVAQFNNPEIKDQKKVSEMITILEKTYTKLLGQGLTIDELKKQITLHMDKKPGVKEDSLRKSRDRLYNSMLDQNLISSTIDDSNGMKRTLLYYKNPKSLEIKF